MADLMDTPIVYEVLIQASRERVYDALTTASELNRWYTTGARVDARPGGELWLRWDVAFGQDAGLGQLIIEAGGPVLKANRPEHFVFQWCPDPENPNYATTVELTLAEANRGTLVQLHETGFEDTPGGRYTFMATAANWGEALTRLKFYLEHGIGLTTHYFSAMK